METQPTKTNTKYFCRLFSSDVEYSKLTQIERKFITALEKDDVSTIEQMLSSDEITLGYKIGTEYRTDLVHALIVRTLSPNMIEMAVRNYPDVFLGRSEPFVELIDHLRIGRKGDRSPTTYWERTGGTITCEFYSRIFDTFGLLIELHKAKSTKSSSIDLIETIFKKIDDALASPFDRACMKGSAEVVTKFLDLITDENREHLREEWFICDGGCNLFHYAYKLPVELVKTIIDRLPFSRSLINVKRSDSGKELPLFSLRNKDGSRDLLDCSYHPRSVARLLVLYGGARVDPLNQRGSTPLHVAIERGDLEMVECFLRMGARTDIVDREGNTALSLALRFGYGAYPNAKDGSSRMVELLLAFGVDLGKEACLRLPPPTNPNQNVEPLRELLCEVRDSNSVNSMARLCRKVIRHQMGPNADEMIKEETIRLPEKLKSFLLVENEPTVLARRT